MLGSGQFSHRDLTAPLITSPVNVKQDYSDVYDEESLHERWFKSTSSISDDDSSDDQLKKKYRFHRKLLTLVFTKWGGILNLLMYLAYILVVILVLIEDIDPTRKKTIRIIAIICGAIWEIAILIPNVAYLWGGRHGFAWGGLYVNILFYVLQIATWGFLETKEHMSGKSFHLNQLLLLFLAAVTYIDQKIIKPSFRKLSWYYLGVISKEESREKPTPISDINSSTLQKVAKNACKATGVSDEAAQTIEQLLEGQRIRKDNKEALDDWTLTIKKITKAVSFAPFSCCQSKSTITSSQCQTLVCQMVIYLRQYMNDGHIEADETDLHRTAPLSFAEALWVMTKFSLQVPLSFLCALIPRSVSGIVSAAIVPSYLTEFANAFTSAAITGTIDFIKAKEAFKALVIIGGTIPIINVLATYVESIYSTKALDLCRRKMLRSMLKGGTKFDEKNRPGALADAFSNQLNQVEMYCMQFYIQMLPQLFTILAAVWLAAKLYPFAVTLFISFVPILLSVEYFEERASKAAHNAVKNDAAFAGKIGSAITCRKAIRACDASVYIENDLEDRLVSTKNAHFSRFLRSNLTRNFLEVSATCFNLAVQLPVGLLVLNQKLDFGTYVGITTALGFLSMPLAVLGMAQSQTLQFSGAIQSVKKLMDDSFDEESPSDKSLRDKTELQPLNNSVNMTGIKFRYNARQPDVLSKVDTSIGKGTYNVICGESGSGKTTVLNLLMRFRQPYEGSVKWDGTNIYDTTLQSFRKQVSVMFQETMIYQTTIRENITFGLPELPGAVEKAARDAEIAEVIERLPDGYDTIIGGDNVTGLSGGQQQRICMARALYKKPSMLLLDEATSALDAETEASIIDTLVNLRDKEGLTLVSVSHHPSTAVKADKIVVLRAGGTVAEEGVYDDLVSREGGIFKRMVEAS